MAKKIPQRQCIGCREQKDKKKLIRIIHTADGEFLMDPSGKMNGRGAYICPDAECLEKAIKGKALDRSFKMTVPQTVYDTLREEFDHFDEQ